MRAQVLAAAVLGLVLVAQTAHAEEPWPGRAELAVTRMLRSKGGVNIARSIQHIAHPTGSDADLTNFSNTVVGNETIQVTLVITWTGGFGGSHLMTVRWTFDRLAHRRAIVTSDDAPVGISAKNALQLDAYFRDEVYPGVRQAAGN